LVLLNILMPILVGFALVFHTGAFFMAYQALAWYYPGQANLPSRR
jgi:hypothetical protein